MSPNHLLPVVFGRKSSSLLVNTVKQWGTEHPWEDQWLFPVPFPLIFCCVH